ncbi:hypothetical protein BDR06DRAFT_999827 [Suillus hirtellus]|nr:hypothetical protein BDR06DRAFT_999827 [Suillus hirtellus]
MSFYLRTATASYSQFVYSYLNNSRHTLAPNDCILADLALEAQPNFEFLAYAGGPIREKALEQMTEDRKLERQERIVLWPQQSDDDHRYMYSVQYPTAAQPAGHGVILPENQNVGNARTRTSQAPSKTFVVLPELKAAFIIHSADKICVRLDSNSGDSRSYLRAQCGCRSY